MYSEWIVEPVLRFGEDLSAVPPEQARETVYVLDTCEKGHK